MINRNDVPTGKVEIGIQGVNCLISQSVPEDGK